MLHHGRQRHRERLGEFAHGNAVTAFELRQQGAARRVRQGGKRAIERVGWIVNHMVKYRGEPLRVKGSN